MNTMTASCSPIPSLSKPSASRFVNDSSRAGEREFEGLLASIHIGLSVGWLPGGKRYDRMLHFGISSRGHGEEYIIVLVLKGLYEQGEENEDGQ